jgi:putative transposase
MGFMRISVGGRVLVESGEAVITHVVSGDQVIVRDLATGAVHPLAVRSLKLAPGAAATPQHTDLSLISQENWAAAQTRYEAIQPLLEAPRMDAHVLQEAARKTGRHQATIYRWLKRYRQEEQQTALIPAKRGVEPGHCRLKPEIDAIIQAAIQERYLTRNRVKVTQLHRDVALKCRSAGLPVPHVNTLRNRISQVAPRTLVEGRWGKRAAREQFEPILGHFPSADRPLAVVQIDHTKLDLIVVDEVDRKPLARPWFTVAIDVCSRVVPGFYLSLEAPGAASTGMCVACAILPKDHLLAKWGITTPWPVWGKMAAIHCETERTFGVPCSAGRASSMASSSSSGRCASPTTVATSNA